MTSTGRSCIHCDLLLHWIQIMHLSMEPVDPVIRGRWLLRDSQRDIPSNPTSLWSIFRFILLRKSLFLIMFKTSFLYFSISFLNNNVCTYRILVSYHFPIPNIQTPRSFHNLLEGFVSSCLLLLQVYRFFLGLPFFSFPCGCQLISFLVSAG